MRSIVLSAVLVCLLAGCGGGGESGGTATRPAETQAEGAGTGSAETAPPAETGESTGPLRLEPVVQGLDSPVYLTTAPGDPDTLYVVLQGGRIVVVQGGQVRPEPFLDVASEVVSGGEQGLLSLAFHPDYERNGKLYVDYTNLDGDTRVVEYRAPGDRASVDPSTARVVLAVDQPYANHNGGQLEFGRDGRLWVGLGDGGAGGDPENRAQNLSDRLGKLLRIDVDGATPNVDVAAYGLRNPWRFSFDRSSGDLWVGDVGQNAFEEIDRLPAARVGSLANFGWDAFEGRARYEDKQPNPAGRLVGPVAVYSHDDGCSVTGGYVYRGPAAADAAGRYFYGDYCSGKVWSLRLRDSRAVIRVEPFTVPSLSSFGEDGHGRLYLVSLEGTIFRLAS